MLVFSFLLFFIISGASFADSNSIVIKGQGNVLSVQVDNGTCIEFKMETKENKVTQSDGTIVTHSITQYKYWRPCGEEKWVEYRKGDVGLLRTPSTIKIFKVPKKRYL
jgi:galactokinase